MSVKYEIPVIFLFLLFPVFRSTQVSEVDLDEGMESGIRCFWHIMCNMTKPLLIKESVDAINVDLLKEILEDFGPRVPEEVSKIVTIENALSDVFWVETLQPLACSFPEDIKIDYAKDMCEEVMKYLQVLCEREGNAKKCLTFEKSTEIYDIMQGKMVQKGECYLPHFNKDELLKTF